MDKVSITNGGIGNEPIWKSRRLWGAVLSAIAAGLVAFSPDKYQVVASIAGFIAAALGIVSWTMPK